jgi:predicted dehydrogenase
MDRGNLSRRGFMQRSLAGLAAAGLPLWYARQLLAADEERAAKERKAGPNDRLAVGAIGCGGQGMGIAKAARGQKGVEVVAACDVDAGHLAKAVEEFGKDCKGYKDFRELLDRKDIDAVTIGTPDHWHVLIALDALRKGKDVYCEKPLTLTIEEGKALVKVAKETGRVFQVGTQQRSDAIFRLACELVRNGRLGKLQRVETLIGANPRGGPFPVAEPPKDLDWDFWQGQTGPVPYIKDRCHYQFRWWYEYSGGKMTDWGAHHNDIAQWALGADGSGPAAVEAIGEPPPADDRSFNCHPHFLVQYLYKRDGQPDFWHKDGVHLVCSSLENGVRFTGDPGRTLFVSRNKAEFKASDPKIIDEPLGNDAVRLYESKDHMGNFIDCVRSRKPTICPAEVGHRSVSVCHIGVIALRSGKKLKWDPAKEEFVGDADANKMLSRKMRAPWKLDV